MTILVTKRETRLHPRQSPMAEGAQRDPVSKNIWVALTKRMGSGMAQLSGGQQEARGVQRQHRGHWRRRRSAGSAQVLPAAPGAEHRQGWIAETGKDKSAELDLGDLNPDAVELRYGLDDDQNSRLDRHQ